MAEKVITIITGKIAYDVFGSWEDCSPGLYLGTIKIENIFAKYKGKYIKITIEEANNG